MPVTILLLVLSEVADDVGIQIEGHHGDVVVGAQLLGEGPRGIERIQSEGIAAGRVLHEDEHGDGRLGAAKPLDPLLYAVFVDAKVGGFEVGHELVGFLQQHAHVDRDLGDLDAQAEVGRALRVLELWLSGSRRGRVVGIVGSSWARR